MKHHENQPFNPTGCVSVPLFNQKKRHRVPLTSAPSMNETYGLSEYMPNASPDPSYSKAPGGCESYRPLQPKMSAPQSIPQPFQPPQYGSNRPAPRAAPTVRQYAPLAHPYKAGNESFKMGQTLTSVSQKAPGPSVKPRFSKYQLLQNNSSGQSSHSGLLQMIQQPSCKLPNASYQISEQSAHQHPPAQAAPRPKPSGQQQSMGWNFTNSFGPQSLLFEGAKSKKSTTPNFQIKTKPAFQIKPAVEMSLRILTAVIDGMRHWSQFKDKVPYLSEIFATLDSAVTLGPYGAKNFLIRDGKEVVQCFYYENEQELPRLIRGQVHRCVGNYDRSRRVLVCVSIRPALPSELTNAQEAVKVCDAEMRALVKSFTEV